MDGNKDAAERCVEFARAALDAGDADKAMRLLLKSQRLYPLDEAVALMNRLRSKSSSGRAQQSQSSGEDSGSASGRHANSNGTSRHDEDTSGSRTSASRKADAHASSTGVNQRNRAKEVENPQASPEQVTLVTRILRTQSYYEILEVPKDSNDDDVKKAYRKLSLKVHPDKNKARGAEEAFKVVSRAFKCLSDPDLRANYDRYGHEDPDQLIRQRQQRQRQREYQDTRSYSPFDDDFDPNDVFNAFFGVNQAQARMFRAHFEQQQQRAYQRAAASQGNTNANNTSQGFMAILQLLPVLLFLLLAFLPSNEPVHRLQRTSTHTQEQHTRVNHIPYYVRPGQDFEKLYPVGSKKLAKVEASVEAEYREHLESRCYHEQVQQAQYYRWGQAQKARGMAMPYCDELRRLRSAIYV